MALVRGLPIRVLVPIGMSLALATVAFAQTRARAPSPHPKPARAADAGVVDAVGDDAGAQAAGPGGVAEGGTPAAPKSEPSDGGLKPSPLNAQPNELPAGAPWGTMADYDRILGEIAALRARVAAVEDGLVHSRIGIALETEGERASIVKLSVSLDDGVVYTAPANFRGSDAMPIYEHAVSPGRHAVTLDIDRKDTKDEAFRTSQRSRFVVDVPKDQRLSVELRVSDDSTMGSNFSSDGSGRYDLRVRMKVAARPVAR